MSQCIFTAHKTGLLQIKLGSVTVNLVIHEGDTIALERMSDDPKCSVCGETGYAIPDEVYCECRAGRALQFERTAAQWGR
jgi:rubredoxin